MPQFSKSLSAPDPIPEEGIAKATALMQSGRLFRYGEQRAEELEVSLLEGEFAAYVGAPYACAVNSGGCALFLALRALGVAPGEPVLVNAFTLAPVPSAIHHAGATPVLIEVTEDYLIDIKDLEAKAVKSGARVLLLSHMRGHVADMDTVTDLCERHNLHLVEDCAHTLGAKWRGTHLGTFGAAGCYSAQTFKHINSGEGGLIVSRDEDVAAKVVLQSGSYMLFGQNGARPSEEAFARWKDVTPNYSMRMSALQAAILRPQLELLEARALRWNERYTWLSAGLDSPYLRLPERSAGATFVASSLQFSVDGLSEAQLSVFQQICDDQGVHLKWFGRDQAVGFTSTHKNWAYLQGAGPLEQTDRVMRGLFDMRIPLSLTQDDCSTICAIISSALEQAKRA